MSSGRSLVDEVLAGTNAGLMKLAAEGVLPLPQGELMRVQVALTGVDDSEVAELARQSLSQVDAEFLVSHLRQDAPQEVLAYFARTSTNRVVVEAVFQRRDIGYELLMELAPQIEPAIQEILLLRQDVIVQHPEILSSLELNTRLSTYSERTIAEYREHLLAAPTIGETLGDETGAAADETFEWLDAEFADDPELQELRAAIEEVLEEVPPEGELDERTGLTEGQIRSLTPPLRVKLARGASRALRTILIRDQNPQVATAVLSGSPVTESEVELISANRSVVEEVFTAIAGRREWIRKYSIVHNLVCNPRAPIGVTMRLLPRLSVRDLRTLRSNHGVADAIRQAAMRMYRAKTAR